MKDVRTYKEWADPQVEYCKPFSFHGGGNIYGNLYDKGIGLVHHGKNIISVDSRYGVDQLFYPNCGTCTGKGDARQCGEGHYIGALLDQSFTLNGIEVRVLDFIPTGICHVRGNIAMGFSVKADLTITPCWIVRDGFTFAHGETLHEANSALRAKLAQYMPLEMRLQRFKETFPYYDKQYPKKELYEWHGILTLSCNFGRQVFCEDNGITLDGTISVKDFIALTIGAYEPGIMRKLRDLYEK